MKTKILGLLTVALFCAAAPAYSGVILFDLDPIAVDTTSFSVNSNNEAAIKFVNQLSTGVDVYFIDYSGDRVFYQTLAAGAEAVQLTFLTHPWLVVLNGTGGTTAQGSGALWTAFMAQTSAPWTAGDFDIAYIRAVPEPGTLALLGLGLAGLGLSRRRKTV